MGADCGCGGTCPMCSRVLGWQIAEHIEIIKKAVVQEEPAQEGIKPEGEESED